MTNVITYISKMFRRGVDIAPSVDFGAKRREELREAGARIRIAVDSGFSRPAFDQEVLRIQDDLGMRFNAEQLDKVFRWFEVAQRQRTHQRVKYARAIVQKHKNVTVPRRIKPIFKVARHMNMARMAMQ